MTTKSRSIFDYWNDEAERPYLQVAFMEGRQLDDAQRAAYAQVLDTRDPIRAEWLRLELKLHAVATGDIDEHNRFRDLSRQIAADFLQILRRSDVLNCGGTAEESKRVRFSFICEKRWETLLPTENSVERHCNACNSRVYRCSTVKEAENHALAGHCIAVTPALVNKASEIEHRAIVGRPDPLLLWAEKLFPNK